MKRMPDTRKGLLPWIRQVPEDFVVEEVALQQPAGRGEHLYLWLEKRQRNTADVAQDLAVLAGCAPRDIGFAGRKDRIAVTRQWFSVPLVEASEALSWDLEGVQVLRAVRGESRLQLGELEANRFEIRVRGVDTSEQARISQVAQRLEQRGVAHRFGEQRFGSGGRNVARGAALLRGERVHGDLRHQRFLVSALQAAIFNEVLRRRPWPFDALTVGDLGIVHRSGRLFVVEEEEQGSARLVGFQVSPTGPLWGPKMRYPTGEVAVLEEEVLKDFGLPGAREAVLPKRLRLFGERRPLRLPVSSMKLRFEEESLQLTFQLPPGGYATVVLEEFFPEGFAEGEEQKPAESPLPAGPAPVT
ncbi:MAG: tRNA pseudouridine(13) synthase TruD [Deltaproteobacteria bacterium]|nr:tRNA pseudouridine(13) synthase TruD [Deltaproteobacteria bacterium]